jgi:hypothetical protein
VRKGYLFPWGHRASLITVTEREPTTNHAGQVGAYLRQRTFIVVSQPVKSYGGAGDFAPHAGRYMPFTSVETLTLVTPDLLAPAYFLTKTQQRSNTELVFEPKIATNTPFQFHMRGTDWAGDPIDFRSPVLWIDDTVAYGDGTGSASNKTLMSHVFAAWKKSSSAKSYPSISLHSQRVSVAAPKDPTKVTGDTQMVLSSVALSVVSPSTSNPQSLINASQPAFYPALHSLTIKLPQAGSVSGHAIADTVMAYDSHYLSNGFTNNKGGIFLRRSGSTRNPIKFANQNSGGSVAPNLTVDGYSRELGPASGSVTQLTQGTFDPTQVFHSVDAKLLGGLDLSTILGLVTFGDTSTGGTPSSDNSQALQMTSVEHLNPHRIVTTLEWHPVVLNGGPTVAGQQIEILEVQNPDGNYANKSGGPANIPGSASIMDLHAVIITDLVDSTKSSATVVGQIREFNLNLFGKTGATYFIQIPFSSLTFRAQSGHKTDVDVQVDSGGIAFQGALSFVQDLATYLNFDGSGLTVDTSGSGISATLTLAIPSIGIGLFALENIAFSAGVIIPYNGDPVRFTFAFCSQENPFQLEIMIFTGGGYIALEIGADGVERLEFGFDFGFGLSIDVGIASGQVSLTGGVSYSCAQLSGGGQEVDLTAYVKASGGISALGLVSVSVEMCLSLEYQSDGVTSSLAGDAEMSISVHIIFFGFSVGFDVHEDFAGSDPNSGTFANSGSFASKAIGDRFSSLALADSAAASTLPPWVLNPKPNSFGTAMAQGDWDQYCTSFALLGV